MIQDPQNDGKHTTVCVLSANLFISLPLQTSVTLLWSSRKKSHHEPKRLNRYPERF